MQGEAIAPPLNFNLSENVLLVEKSSSKNTKFAAENLVLHFREFRAKIEIMSTHNNLLCLKFANVCQRPELPTCPTLLSHNSTAITALVNL